MTIRQLSVFIENKAGNLQDLLKVLADNDINIISLTIADTNDFGIVRLLVSEPELALDKLREKHFTVRIHDVISLELSTTPGSFYHILHHFSIAGIGLEYVYAFSYGSKAIAVIRTDNQDKAFELIEKEQFVSISENDLRE